MLYFRNEEIHELPENEKRAIDQPFSHFVIFQFFCILSRKTPNYHGNPDFCLIVRFFPLSQSYQRHPKTRKSGAHQPP